MFENPNAYRAKLQCKIGRDVLCKIIAEPRDMTRIEYAVWYLLHAVEDLAAELENVRNAQKEGVK